MPLTPKHKPHDNNEFLKHNSGKHIFCFLKLFSGANFRVADSSLANKTFKRCNERRGGTETSKDRTRHQNGPFPGAYSELNGSSLDTTVVWDT